MQLEASHERFYTFLISGQRQQARQIIQTLLDDGATARELLNDLFWPTLEQIQNLYRNDQLTELAHHYATRLMRTLVDQLQPQLDAKASIGRRVLLVCGPEEPEELAAQIAADLLEAEGFEVFFGGGGVANDEIVEQLGLLDADVLAIFGAVASTVPATRQLIDHLQEIDLSPRIQLVVGGGVFNRADGLAEEIGADLWAATPQDLVDEMTENPDRRMTPDQRTVGRKRRTTRGSRASEAA